MRVEKRRPKTNNSKMDKDSWNKQRRIETPTIGEDSQNCLEIETLWQPYPRHASESGTYNARWGPNRLRKSLAI